MNQADGEKFWKLVEKGDGCWEWRGARNVYGYGHFVLGRKEAYRIVRANRMAWQLCYGEIPAGLVVCHSCDNRGCVRPDHLWLGTQGENIRDCIRKGRFQCYQSSKTHCKHGHPFDEANTNITPQGWRECRTCGRLKRQRQRAKIRKS